MERSLKKISKLLLITGCMSVLAGNIAIAAPQNYDLGDNDLRADYALPNKIRLEGDVNFDDHGQTINLSLRNTDVQQVLRMFADKAGLNIVFHSSAKGSVTLDLVDVTLEDAFKMVMKMTGLTYVIKDKTMLVVSTSESESLGLTKDNITILPVKYVDAAYVANFLNSNVFSLNNPGISFGPIVTTNSDKNELLIFGTENDYNIAKKIVDRFDRKPAMTTYRVNHTTPFEMAKMVCENLFQLPFNGTLSRDGGVGAGKYKTQVNANFKMQTSLTEAKDGTLGGGTVACTVTSGVSTENLASFQAKPTISIYVQPELGTLTMIGGSEQQIEMVNEFIVENDRKQPQAYLELSIIELSEEGSREFNNSWVYNGKHLNLAFNGSTTSMTTPYMWHGPSNGNSGHTLQQTISYLISNKKGRILSNPKIVITNGKKSVIDLTEDYVESTTVQILTSNSTGDAMTASSQRTYNISDDKGIKFEITPFISPDGYVSLTMKPDYATEKDGIYERATDGTSYLAATLLQRHNLELSNVRIRDEETLLLGGMIREEEANSTGKIPVLGDIPVLGFFFRNQTKSMQKTELLLMITPRIIQDDFEDQNPDGYYDEV